MYSCGFKPFNLVQNSFPNSSNCTNIDYPIGRNLVEKSQLIIRNNVNYAILYDNLNCCGRTLLVGNSFTYAETDFKSLYENGFSSSHADLNYVYMMFSNKMMAKN